MDESHVDEQVCETSYKVAHKMMCGYLFSLSSSRSSGRSRVKPIDELLEFATTSTSLMICLMCFFFDFAAISKITPQELA